MRRVWTGLVAAAFLAAAGMTLHGSSHREAPGISKTPKVDGSDFYMFRSYEPGRQNFVTLLANYIPLQDVYGGPNYFMLDPDALYEIHVDNDGDAREDLTFQFRFRNRFKNLSLNIGGKTIAVPLINIGRIGPDRSDTAALNVIEDYTIDLIRGDRNGGRQRIVNADTGERRFIKPVDRIGDKSIRDDSNPLASVPPNDVYDTYANDHIYPIRIPGCAQPGARVFVGQRREGFVVNLAETFDLINTNPIGPRDGETNDLADKNVTTLALEVPIGCLTRPGQSIVGAWTTASLPKGNNDDHDNKGNSRDDDSDGERSSEAFTQVSRLGSPLVNEVVIGLKDKDRFNSSEPQNDGQFLKYVTNPTLPALIEALFGVQAPTVPRNDLVQVFLTGVGGVNKPPHAVPGEMLRLNTAFYPLPPAQQNSLGVLGGDLAGYPNGRRPGDDIVDIALRAVMGVLLPAAQAPAGQLPYTDGALVNATIAYDPEGTITADPKQRLFRDTFPYLQVPLSGSPNPAHVKTSHH